MTRVSDRSFDALLIIVVLFGLVGTFISNILTVPRIHYLPLALAISAVALRAFLHKKNFSTLLIGGIPVAFSFLFVRDEIGFLSYFVLMVLPFVWFCAGRYIDPTKIARALSHISIVLAIGLAIELTGFFPHLFPKIGVRVGDIAYSRYGSLALNPLALGYFASMTGVLALVLRRRAARVMYLGICLVLLYFADSRGGFVMFVFFLVLYLWVGRAKGNRISVGFSRLLLMTVLLSMIAIGLVSSERTRSVFDWKNDEGNVGRLSQWGYCLGVADQNPLGIGAGRMSPIGLGDDPYIAEGVVRSCDSTPLLLSAEYGFTVAFLYVFAISALLVMATRRAMRRGGITLSTQIGRNLAVAIALCWGIWAQQLFNQTLESVWINAIFFSFLGHLFWRSRGSGFGNSEDATPVWGTPSPSEIAGWKS